MNLNPELIRGCSQAMCAVLTSPFQSNSLSFLSSNAAPNHHGDDEIKSVIERV
jgi:hypothetical protein